MKTLLLLALAGLGVAGCSTYYEQEPRGSAGTSYQTGVGHAIGFANTNPNRASPYLPGDSSGGSFPTPVIPLSPTRP
jgi:hypothetical protein